MQPEIVHSESPPDASVSPAAGAVVREPFWGYLDILLFVGIAFALLIVFCLPIVIPILLRPALSKNIVLLALASQAALYAAVYCGLRIVLGMRYHRPVFASLGWRRSSFHPGLAAICGVGLAFAVAGLVTLMRAPKVPSPIEQFTNSPATLAIIGVMAVTAAPVFEELLFRGFLQPVFSRTFGTAIGIVITAALFGLLHIPEYSYVWQYGAAITLIGIVFGYVRHRTGSLIPSTAMHAAFNSMSVVALVASKYAKL